MQIQRQTQQWCNASCMIAIISLFVSLIVFALEVETSVAMAEVKREIYKMERKEIASDYHRNRIRYQQSINPNMHSYSEDKYSHYKRHNINKDEHKTRDRSNNIKETFNNEIENVRILLDNKDAKIECNQVFSWDDENKNVLNMNKDCKIIFDSYDQTHVYRKKY